MADIIRNSKIILFTLGLLIILLFTGYYLLSKSTIDLLFISLGIIVIISALFTEYKDNKIILNLNSSYLISILFINISQWLILFYTILYIRIDLTLSTLIFLTIAPFVTINLIRIYIKNRGQKSEMLKNIKSILSDKSKTTIILIGFVVMIGSLVLFYQTTNIFVLYWVSIGIMAIIYGYHRENKPIKSIKEESVLNQNYIYQDVKKIKITTFYFISILFILIFQWLILYYVVFVVSKFDTDIISVATFFTFLATVFFYIQIRESHFVRITWQGTYIGKKKIL